MVFFMVKFLVVMDATDTKNIKKLLHVNRVCVENLTAWFLALRDSGISKA